MRDFVHAQPRRRLLLASASTILAATGLSGCKPEAPPSPAKPTAPVSVQVAAVKTGEIGRTITLPSARILAFKEVTLYAKVSGYLKTLGVDKGDRVKEGQVVAEIEVPELLADLQRLEAEVSVARTNYERVAGARQKAADLIMPQTVDDLRGQWQVAEAKLKHVRALLDYTHIIAPFSGTITARNVDPGAFIPAATAGGSPQNAALVTLMDYSQVRVQVFVPEAEASFIKKGTPVKVTPEISPAKTKGAAVTRFAYALDPATKTMLTEIEMPNEDGEIRPGGYAQIQMEVERKQEALLVPAAAVLVEKSGSSVFTIVDGKAKKILVSTGFTDGANVEIREGLKVGQEVVLLGKQPLNDGQVVTIAEAK